MSLTSLLSGKVRFQLIRPCLSTQLFLHEARLKLEIRDDIVDEHSLILFINWCGTREQLNRKFEYIPGTRIGAVSPHSQPVFSSSLIPPVSSQSQIKKGFYGALRIRKQQDAENPSLAAKRPASTVYVWDLVKTRMREAIVRHRQYVKSGLSVSVQGHLTFKLKGPNTGTRCTRHRREHVSGPDLRGTAQENWSRLSLA